MGDRLVCADCGAEAVNGACPDETCRRGRRMGLMSKAERRQAPVWLTTDEVDEVVMALRHEAMGLLKDWPLRADQLGLLSDRIGQASPPRHVHDYVSTACRHDIHGQCRRTCKFCDRPCRCACHIGETHE